MVAERVKAPVRFMVPPTTSAPKPFSTATRHFDFCAFCQNSVTVYISDAAGTFGSVNVCTKDDAHTVTCPACGHNGALVQGACGECEGRARDRRERVFHADRKILAVVVRMIERGRSPRLTLEALERRRVGEHGLRQKLQRDAAPELPR